MLNKDFVEELLLMNQHDAPKQCQESENIEEVKMSFVRISPTPENGDGDRDSDISSVDLENVLD